MSEGNLQEATVSGIRWLAVMRVVSESIGFLSAVALARLVTPAQFGHAAIPLIVITLGVILTFEGFASALIQRETVTEDDRRAAMLMSIIGGLVLTGMAYGLAGPVWTPVFGARTAALMRLVSPALFIASLGGVSRSMVWRSLDFRMVSSIDAAALFVGSLSSVGLAIAGDGATAIVLGGVVQTLMTTVLLCVVSPPPLPRWSRASQREISTFGVPAALAGLLGVSFANIDYAILAARLPAATVGLYYRAFNISVVYQDKVSKIMTQIAFPVYARTKSREQLRIFHERVARLHALIIFPLLATSAALAPILVPLVFGNAWRAAVPATQVLAAAGCVAAVLTGYPQIMLAIGRPKPLMYFNVAMVIGYGTAIFLASRHGLVVIAVAVSSAYVLILLGVYQLLLKRYVGLSIRRLLPELGPAVTGSAALVGVELAVRAALPGVPGIIVAVLAGAAGVLTYGLVVGLLFREAFNDVVSLVVRVAPPAGRLLRRGEERPVGLAHLPAVGSRNLPAVGSRNLPAADPADLTAEATTELTIDWTTVGAH